MAACWTLCSEALAQMREVLLLHSSHAAAAKHVCAQDRICRPVHLLQHDLLSPPASCGSCLHYSRSGPQQAFRPSPPLSFCQPKPHAHLCTDTSRGMEGPPTDSPCRGRRNRGRGMEGE